MVTNKSVCSQFDAEATRQAVKTETVKMVSYITASDDSTADDLFKDPAWQAALEAEVLARHNNGGQPL
jgi:hypothetical protein